MEASKVTIMAFVVLTLILSPAFVVSNVEEATEPNAIDPKRLLCQISCSAACVAAPDRASCLLVCLTNCLKGKKANTNADFCTTGCILTTCDFEAKPDSYNVKTCAKSCSDGCSKSSKAYSP